MIYEILQDRIMHQISLSQNLMMAKKGETLYYTFL